MVTQCEANLPTPGTPGIVVHSYVLLSQQFLLDFPGGLDSKAPAYNVGDLGSIPRSGRSPGEGKGYPTSILAWRILRTRGIW